MRAPIDKEPVAEQGSKCEPIPSWECRLRYCAGIETMPEREGLFARYGRCGRVKGRCGVGAPIHRFASAAMPFPALQDLPFLTRAVRGRFHGGAATAAALAGMVLAVPLAGGAHAATQV